MNDYLPWHTQQWRNLHKRQQHNKFPHALLLTGPPGVGKLIFAQQLAHLLLCTNVVTDRQTGQLCVCNNCKSCNLIRADNHPDKLMIMPEEEGKGIKVDAVRSIVNFVNQSAYSNQHKVIIIHPADKMNVNAANALLKSLEEPNAKVVIILVTHRLMSLPATVRSRCQIIPFPEPKADIAREWLQQQNVSTQHLKLLLDLAHGAPLQVLKFIEQDMLTLRNQLFKLWYDLLQGKVNIVTVSQEWCKLDVHQILLHLTSWIMDLIYLQNVIDAQLVNTDFTTSLQNIATRYNSQQLYRFYDILLSTQHLLHGQANLNLQLMLEGLLAPMLR